jgi:hypothetical protein
MVSSQRLRFANAGVVLALTASPNFADYYAFQPIVHTLIEESRRFQGPVYLFNGDSHI